LPIAFSILLPTRNISRAKAYFFAWLIAVFSSYAFAAGRQGDAALPTRADAAAVEKLPLIASYRQSLSGAQGKAPFVLRLFGEMGNDALEAQELALADARFTAHAQAQGKTLRAEVMGVYPLRESDVSQPDMAQCQKAARCFRVDLYNFATNDGYVATVDQSGKRVLAVNKLTGIAPEISARLERAAITLAMHSPLVEKALKRKPVESDFVMATTRTSLAKSRCERSGHLCVAPTIVDGNSALFVIVDLTDFRVAGVRWNKLGRAGVAPTERRVQNEAIAREYCEKATAINRDGWSFNFQITSSDGVRVGEIAYRGKPWLKSVKTVDWHVRYSWKDRYGYSDAVGCPMFSQAAVVAIDPPEFVDLLEEGKKVGFSLIQDFRSDQWPKPCNYYYRQRFDFYNDGRFRPVSASFGRGCGDDATYRPVTRIEFAASAHVSQWSGTKWERWLREDWKLAEKLSAAPSGATLLFSGAENAATELVVNKGGWENSRGDNPLLYVTLHPADRDEGASDLPSIGTCCNQDHRQGPEKFMQPPESIPPQNTAPLVLWYVAQLQNDSKPGSEYCWADFVLTDGVYQPKAYPCFSGPLLRPVRISP
jgi:hypothetical protein